MPSAALELIYSMRIPRRRPPLQTKWHCSQLSRDTLKPQRAAAPRPNEPWPCVVAAMADTEIEVVEAVEVASGIPKQQSRRTAKEQHMRIRLKS
mmetsp:Transcript_30482/g.93181  ORF Transcript_30482/g.93181 Transcript_30482/m.93181 type:complete len:94 (-) Transcript_30482:806-1087(-)